MLNSISWQGYFLALLLLLALYYSIILFVYYSLEIKQVFLKMNLNGKEKKTPLAFATHVPKEMYSRENLSHYTQPENIEEQLAENKVISLKIKAIVAEAASKIADNAELSEVKEALIQDIRQLLSTYPKVKGTYYEPAFTFFVAHECREQCSIHLSQEELESLWTR